MIAFYLERFGLYGTVLSVEDRVRSVNLFDGMRNLVTVVTGQAWIQLGRQDEGSHSRMYITQDKSKVTVTNSTTPIKLQASKHYAKRNQSLEEE
jgi:hypothetical protein